MVFDVDFDQSRLNQLSKQCLSGSTIEGRVFFLSDSEDNRLDHARWLFANTDYDALEGSGFKSYLMELLDDLLVYRAQHGQPEASRGVVHVHGSQLTVEWLSKERFESLCRM